MLLETKFLSAVCEVYDGSQLEVGRNFRQHGLLGSSVIAWIGPCDVAREHMIDGEDWREKKAIQADKMLHFVGELFHVDIVAGILLTRLMASQLAEIVKGIGDSRGSFIRKGDDVYSSDGKKLNVSIVTQKGHRVLFHFGINVGAQGAPVPVLGLEDLGISAPQFAAQMLYWVKAEWEDIFRASYKAL
ncbi:MAG: DUF366 family protein [Bdellovibrionaceae bacterium]|nr:DUF366 family protein [Pseudobdellovibrionaceae bacterium]